MSHYSIHKEQSRQLIFLYNFVFFSAAFWSHISLAFLLTLLIFVSMFFFLCISPFLFELSLYNLIHMSQVNGIWQSFFLLTLYSSFVLRCVHDAKWWTLRFMLKSCYFRRRCRCINFFVQSHRDAVWMQNWSRSLHSYRVKLDANMSINIQTNDHA